MKMLILIAILLSTGCAVQDAVFDWHASVYTDRCERIGHAQDSPELRQCVTDMFVAANSRVR